MQSVRSMNQPSISDGSTIIEPTTAASLQTFAKACQDGNLDTVAALAASDNHLPSTQHYLNHGLLASIIHTQLPTARFLLSHGATITPPIAMAAVRAQSIPVFTLLVDEHGWDVNTPLMGGQTALSAFVQNEPLLQFFLARGADPNLGPPLSPQPHSPPVTDSGVTLNCAASVGTPAVFALLLAHGANLEHSQPLHMAAASQDDGEGRIAMMEYLVRETGCDVNASDEARGWYAVGPPLFYAVRQGHVNKVRWLLGHGADARVAGKGGSTALMLAERTGMAEMIALVKEALGQGGG